MSYRKKAAAILRQQRKDARAARRLAAALEGPKPITYKEWGEWENVYRSFPFMSGEIGRIDGVRFVQSVDPSQVFVDPA